MRYIHVHTNLYTKTAILQLDAFDNLNRKKRHSV